MTKNGTATFIAENKMQLLLLSFTAFITVANLYIAAQLSPIKGDIGRIETLAVENRKTLDSRADSFSRINVIDDRVEMLLKSIDTINGKLDTIILQGR